MKIKWLDLFEWALRINVFLKLFNYGVGKIIGQQFYRKGEIPTEVGTLSLAQTESFDLAWTFFGHSEGYILFIGITQLLGALLFLLPRTKLIGGLMLIPVLVNIIVVDFFFNVAWGALFAAVFYLCSILFVLGRNRVRLGNLLKSLVTALPAYTGKKWLNIALVIASLIVVFAIELGITMLLGYEAR